MIGSCHVLQLLTFCNIVTLGADSQVAGRGADGNSFHLVIATIIWECLLYACMVFLTHYFIKIYKTAC